MARSCSVCRDPRVKEINIRCLEGQGTQQIAQDFGISRAMIDNHRQSGHAGKALTAMVLDAHSGPLSELHQYFIASKANRIRRLDELLRMSWEALETQAARGKDAIDPVLIKVSKDLMESASKELGEWSPDGGKKADATAALAQSIVIHAAVAAKLHSTPSLTPNSDKSSESETDIVIESEDVTGEG